MQEKLYPSKGMIKKDDSSYSCSPHQYGEFSRKTEVRRNSHEEVLHKKLVSPSNPRNGNLCKTCLGRDVHSKEGIKKFTTRMKKFPTGKIDMNVWSMYPCASCGTSNHNMVKCQRR